MPAPYPLLKAFLLVLPGLGLTGLAWKARRDLRYLQAHGRPTTGTVTKLTVQHSRSGRLYQADVDYPTAEAGPQTARRLLVDAACVVGARPALRYDPRRPAWCVLEEHLVPRRELPLLLLGLGMLVVGLYGAAALLQE
jgi:hypothetical protein